MSWMHCRGMFSTDSNETIRKVSCLCLYRKCDDLHANCGGKEKEIAVCKYVVCVCTAVSALHAIQASGCILIYNFPKSGFRMLYTL